MRYNSPPMGPASRAGQSLFKRYVPFRLGVHALFRSRSGCWHMPPFGPGGLAGEKAPRAPGQVPPGGRLRAPALLGPHGAQMKGNFQKSAGQRCNWGGRASQNTRAGRTLRVLPLPVCQVSARGWHSWYVVRNSLAPYNLEFSLSFIIKRLNDLPLDFGTLSCYKSAKSSKNSPLRGWHTKEFCKCRCAMGGSFRRW
jgi:hypothetical protein